MFDKRFCKELVNLFGCYTVDQCRIHFIDSSILFLSTDLTLESSHHESANRLSHYPDHQNVLRVYP